MILRKLLASSSLAIAGTLETLRIRLETLRDEQTISDPGLAESLIEAEEIEDELLDEILTEGEEPKEESAHTPSKIDREKLREEIAILRHLTDWAKGIGIDTKTRTLLKALDIGFEQMVLYGCCYESPDLH